MQIPPGHDIHHRDGDHSNNDPMNLRLILHGHHTIFHHSGAKMKTSVKWGGMKKGLKFIEID